MAQCAFESRGFVTPEEGMLYRTPEHICATWPERVPEPSHAERMVGAPQLLADTVHSGRWGASGDGWRYRGRGLIRLLGRATRDLPGRRRCAWAALRAAAGSGGSDTGCLPDSDLVVARARPQRAGRPSADRCHRPPCPRSAVGCLARAQGAVPRRAGRVGGKTRPSASPLSRIGTAFGSDHLRGRKRFFSVGIGKRKMSGEPNPGGLRPTCASLVSSRHGCAPLRQARWRSRDRLGRIRDALD